MKTSLTDLITTERYLKGALEPGDMLLFESRLQIDGQLRQHTFFHRMVHRLVLLFHRKKMKCELEQLHARILHNTEKTSYRESVLKLFNK